MIIIDRFEGETAVLETDEGMINAERAVLPHGVKEGDVLRFENGVYICDIDATEARRAAVREKFSRLRRRNND